MPPSGGIFLRTFDGHFLWVKWPSGGLKVCFGDFGCYISMAYGGGKAANGLLFMGSTCSQRNLMNAQTEG